MKELNEYISMIEYSLPVVSDLPTLPPSSLALRVRLWAFIRYREISDRD